MNQIIGIAVGTQQPKTSLIHNSIGWNTGTGIHLRWFMRWITTFSRMISGNTDVLSILQCLKNYTWHYVQWKKDIWHNERRHSLYSVNLGCLNTLGNWFGEHLLSVCHGHLELQVARNLDSLSFPMLSCLSLAFFSVRVRPNVNMRNSTSYSSSADYNLTTWTLNSVIPANLPLPLYLPKSSHSHPSFS